MVFFFLIITNLYFLGNPKTLLNRIPNKKDKKKKLSDQNIQGGSFTSSCNSIPDFLRKRGRIFVYCSNLIL